MGLERLVEEGPKAAVIDDVMLIGMEKLLHRLSETTLQKHCS
jgi:hypothetical protein